MKDLLYLLYALPFIALLLTVCGPKPSTTAPVLEEGSPACPPPTTDSTDKLEKLSKDELISSIKAEQERLDACHAPGSYGKVKVSLVTVGDGTACEIVVEPTPEFEGAVPTECVRQVFTEMRFPSPRARQHIHTFPIVFHEQD